MKEVKTTMLDSCNKVLLYSILATFISLLISLAACYEPIEGCQDIQATNYDVSADNPCPSCCTYPKLTLSIEHLMGDTTLKYGDPYTLDGSHYFKLARLRYYLSDIKLIRQGMAIGVTDTLQLDLLVDGERQLTITENNFALIQRNQFSYILGSIQETGRFDSLSFYVGIAMPVNTADPEDLPSAHPLAPKTEPMHWSLDSGYIFNQLLLQRDTFVQMDTTILNIGFQENLTNVRLPFGKELSVGFDAIITLKVNYLEWFKGVDFEQDSEPDIIRKIVDNTADAFSVE